MPAYQKLGPVPISQKLDPANHFEGGAIEIGLSHQKGRYKGQNHSVHHIISCDFNQFPMVTTPSIPRAPAPTIGKLRLYKRLDLASFSCARVHKYESANRTSTQVFKHERVYVLSIQPRPPSSTSTNLHDSATQHGQTRT
ncbi:uncharacterized protein LOC143188687 [Calliopsis andreniformis]|uniref:uncharacterized protein LOC143188687 n=1 Tax=Calliopsis andreniformis TaxID=337506 RepID=UPI003FCC5C55